jgi:hypothetical protein
MPSRVGGPPPLLLHLGSPSLSLTLSLSLSLTRSLSCNPPSLLSRPLSLSLSTSRDRSRPLFLSTSAHNSSSNLEFHLGVRRSISKCDGQPRRRAATTHRGSRLTWLSRERELSGSLCGRLLRTTGGRDKGDRIESGRAGAARHSGIDFVAQGDRLVHAAALSSTAYVEEARFAASPWLRDAPKPPHPGSEISSKR